MTTNGQPDRTTRHRTGRLRSHVRALARTVRRSAWVLSQRVPIVLFAVTTLGALTSCSGERASEATASSPAEVEQTTAATLLDVASEHPVDREWMERIELGAAQRLDARAFAEAQRRTAHCMTLRGFDYVEIEYVDSDRLFGRLSNPLRQDVAERFGYHSPPVPGIVIPNGATTEAFASALGGDRDGKGGCALEAQIVVREPGREFFDLYGLLMATLSQSVSGFWGSRTALALSIEWSACMAQSGYRFESPLDPLRQYAGAPTITRQERSTRMADLACDEKVGLTVARSSWEQASFDEWTNANSLNLQQLVELSAEYDAVLRSLENGIL